MSGSKTRLALLLSSLLVSACTVGEIPPRNQQSSGTDAGGATGNGCVDRLTGPAVDKHQHDDGGTDNAGQDCTQSGCHMQGAAGTSGKGNKAPEYMYGGTLYKSDQTTPEQGAVIKIIDQGMTGMYYTDSGGNFFIPTGDTALPTQIKSATVTASACPNITPMAENLMQLGCGDGGGACHAKNGTAYGTGGKLFLTGD
jgi:hypothetical protein